MAFDTILFNHVEVLSGSIIIGVGLAYFDGVDILRPDIVSLAGEILPAAWYTLRPISEPRLAVMPRNIQ